MSACVSDLLFVNDYLLDKCPDYFGREFDNLRVSAHKPHKLGCIITPFLYS